MQMVIVIRQLSAVLDELLVRETYRVQLTPEDALLLAWIVQQPGIGCTRLAERLGRKKQSVQRTLERLQKRGLVEGYEGCFRKRNAGWGLTASGQKIWDWLADGLRLQDENLQRNGADLRGWVNGLEELMRIIHGITRIQKYAWGQPMVIPPKEEAIPDWDH